MRRITPKRYGSQFRAYEGDSAENSIMQTISIAVSAILIAAGLITAPSLINNARDTNAKQDLANIAIAQEYQLSDTGSYTHDMAEVTLNASAKITLSSGSQNSLISGTDCYAGFTKSVSGTYFYRTSGSTVTNKIPTAWYATKPAGYPSNCTWPTMASALDKNLFDNPSFESNVTYWYPNTGAPTVSLSAAFAAVGTGSMKLTGTGTSTDLAVFTNSVNLLPSTTYTLSWYVYSMDARTVFVDVSGPNINASTLGSKAVPAGVWTKASTTFTTGATAGTNTAFYFHNTGGPGVAGSVLYMDAMSIE